MGSSFGRNVFIIAPCRTYQYMKSAGGSVPFGAMLAYLALAAVGGGVAALVALVMRGHPATAFWTGAGIGIGIGWVVYTSIVVLALHLAGRDYSEILKKR